MLKINYRKFGISTKDRIINDTHIHTKENYNVIYSNEWVEIIIYGNNSSVDIYKGIDKIVLLDGYCYEDGKLISVKNISLDKDKSWMNNVSKLTGSFNIIIYEIKSNNLHVKSDKFGSRLLFYHESESNFYIASRLFDLVKYSNSTPSISNISKQEFLYYNGFMQNSRTLLEDFFIFPTNKLLNISRSNVKWDEFTIPMYRFGEKNNFEEFLEQWKLGFDILLEKYQNKNILVPLSAGLDSRAVLSELSSRGLNDQITTFTFSHPNSYELKISQEVAKSLGVRHKAIYWTQKDVLDFENYEDNVINTDGMIFANPYIPNHLYRDFINEGDVIWSGFSGDPLMGSHTLDNLHIDNNKSLADFCFQKYSNLNSHELSLLNIDFDFNNLKREMEKSTHHYKNKNLIEGFDSWYMQNRNRYTTQSGVTGNRDVFEFVFPFLWISDYAYTSRLKGRYGRSDFLTYVKSLYKTSFNIANSSDWPFNYSSISRVSNFLNDRLSKRSLYIKNAPVCSYKFNYDHFLWSSKPFRNKLLDQIESLDNNKLIKSMDQLVQCLDQKQLSFTFIDIIRSFLIIEKTFTNIK